jgi:hypothetical protein
LYLIIRYAPWLAIACAVFLAAFTPAILLGEWLDKRPSSRQRKAVTNIGRGCLMVCSLAIKLALTGLVIFAIWVWFPPIGDIPLAQHTLNQILGALFGAFWLLWLSLLYGMPIGRSKTIPTITQ